MELDLVFETGRRLLCKQKGYKLVALHELYLRSMHWALPRER